MAGRKSLFNFASNEANVNKLFCSMLRCNNEQTLEKRFLPGGAKLNKPKRKQLVNRFGLQKRGAGDRLVLRLRDGGEAPPERDRKQACEAQATKREARKESEDE